MRGTSTGRKCTVSSTMKASAHKEKKKKNCLGSTDTILVKRNTYDALRCAFPWEETEEGFKYWEDAWDHLIDMFYKRYDEQTKY